MIRKNDIRDENGELLNFENTYPTLLWEKADRNAYRRLDDRLRLLGHKTLQSVHHYRKIGNKIMADETRGQSERKSI